MSDDTTPTAPRAESLSAPLTPRELQLLRVAHGVGTVNAKCLAPLLGVSHQTIRGMWTHVLAKLGAPDRYAAVHRAQRLGLLVPWTRPDGPMAPVASDASPEPNLRDSLVCFAVVLAHLTGNGVAPLESLQRASQASGSQAIAAATEMVADMVAQGAPLSAALSAMSDVFPGPLVRVVRHGEMYGDLGRALSAYAIECQVERYIP